MNRLLRRLRGVLGTGLTWGILWAAIVYTIGVVIGVVDPDSIDPGESPVIMGAITGVVGLVSGVAFSLLLSLAESRRTIRDLSLWRVAMWGVLGSAVFPLMSGRPQMLLILCSLGAASATASIALARKGELRDLEGPRLLDSEAAPKVVAKPL